MVGVPDLIEVGLGPSVRNRLADLLAASQRITRGPAAKEMPAPSSSPARRAG